MLINVPHSLLRVVRAFVGLVYWMFAHLHAGIKQVLNYDDMVVAESNEQHKL